MISRSTRHDQRACKTSGFTLLEVMVAMVIFSIMSLMAYEGLANMLRSNEAVEAYEDDLKSLQRAMMFIDRDFRQLVARPRRTGFEKNALSAAMTSGLDGEGLVEFTRSGNPNPANQPRSSLQRVQYEFKDNQLLRKSWNLVDHLEEEPLVMPLLSDVESVSLRFMDKNNQWQENWGSGGQLYVLPKAIELKLEHKRWGEITRVIPN
jgi:general secretion pathway protein J